MIYRYPKEGLIAGVCVGLARQSGVKPWLVRGLMLLLLLAGGYVIMPLIYLASALLMEKAPDHYYLPNLNKNPLFANQTTATPLSIKITQIYQQMENTKQRTTQLEHYVKSTKFHKNW